MVYTWNKNGKSDPSMMLNGSLAGLVAVTAPCAYIPSWAAILIGLVAGVVVVISAGIVERRFKIDDPVGAISVHGTCGALGLLSVGLFADGRYGVTGLFYGNFNQLLAQIIGIVVLILWVYVTASVAFWILDKTVGLRATPEEESAGMDLSEHNLSAYPEH